MMGGNKIREMIELLFHFFYSDEDGFDIIVDRNTLTFSDLRRTDTFCIKTKQNFEITLDERLHYRPRK